MTRPIRSKSLLAGTALAGLLAAAPLSLRYDFATGHLSLQQATALAKNGGDDNGGGDRGGDGGGHGRGGDDKGGDDKGGSGKGSDDSGSRGGSDDGSGGGKGRGADDGPGHDRGDDKGGQRGRDDRAQGAPAAGTTSTDRTTARDLTKVERSTGGIEVTYTDGWSEELQNGRYELKDARRRTVVERPATAADLARLRALGL